MAKTRCAVRSCRTVAAIAGLCTYHRREQPADVAEYGPVHPNLAKYGLSVDAYYAFMRRQGGRCAICLVDLSWDVGGRKPHIDHDHRTGKVRGVLCVACNTGLGSLGDTVDRLRRAYEYLRDAV